MQALHERPIIMNISDGWCGVNGVGDGAIKMKFMKSTDDMRDHVKGIKTWLFVHPYTSSSGSSSSSRQQSLAAVI
jgi:hypothetical protein